MKKTIIAALLLAASAATLSSCNTLMDFFVNDTVSQAATSSINSTDPKASLHKEEKARQKKQQELIKEGKCPTCGGIGKTADGRYECATCKGTGRYAADS